MNTRRSWIIASWLVRHRGGAVGGRTARYITISPRFRPAEADSPAEVIGGSAARRTRVRRLCDFALQGATFGERAPAGCPPQTWARRLRDDAAFFQASRTGGAQTDFHANAIFLFTHRYLMKAMPSMQRQPSPRAGRQDAISRKTSRAGVAGRPPAEKFLVPRDQHRRDARDHDQLYPHQKVPVRSTAVWVSADGRAPPCWWRKTRGARSDTMSHWRRDCRQSAAAFGRRRWPEKRSRRDLGRDNLKMSGPSVFSRLRGGRRQDKRAAMRLSANQADFFRGRRSAGRFIGSRSSWAWGFVAGGHRALGRASPRFALGFAHVPRNHLGCGITLIGESVELLDLFFSFNSLQARPVIAWPAEGYGHGPSRHAHVRCAGGFASLAALQDFRARTARVVSITGLIKGRRPW